jgi:hypothetical protein
LHRRRESADARRPCRDGRGPGLLLTPATAGLESTCGPTISRSPAVTSDALTLREYRCRAAWRA